MGPSRNFRCARIDRMADWRRWDAPSRFVRSDRMATRRRRLPPLILLFMDDERECPPGYVLARTVAEGRRLIEAQQVTILSLDYDFGYDQPNGMDFLRWMVMFPARPPLIRIHTDNPIARKEMTRYLEQNAPGVLVLQDMRFVTRE